jgi:hypothetical protein
MIAPWVLLALFLWCMFRAQWAGAMATSIALLLLRRSHPWRGRASLRDGARVLIGAMVFGACVFGWPLLLLNTERWFPAVSLIRSFPQWLLVCIVEIPGVALGVCAWVMITRNKSSGGAPSADAKIGPPRATNVC